MEPFSTVCGISFQCEETSSDSVRVEKNPGNDHDAAAQSTSIIFLSYLGERIGLCSEKKTRPGYPPRVFLNTNDQGRIPIPAPTNGPTFQSLQASIPLDPQKWDPWGLTLRFATNPGGGLTPEANKAAN